MSSDEVEAHRLGFSNTNETAEDDEVEAHVYDEDAADDDDFDD